MPVEIRFDSPLKTMVQGVGAYAAGYGQAKQTGAAYQQQSNMLRQQQAGQASMQAFGLIGSMAQQQMAYQNQVGLMNLAHQNALEMLPLQYRNSANLAAMNKWGMPFDGENGLLAAAQKANMDVPSFLQKYQEDTQMRQLENYMRMNSMEYAPTPQGEEQIKKAQAAIADIDTQEIPETAKAELRTQYLQQIDNAPRGLRPRRSPPSYQELQAQGRAGIDPQAQMAYQIDSKGDLKWTPLRQQKEGEQGLKPITVQNPDGTTTTITPAQQSVQMYTFKDPQSGKLFRLDAKDRPVEIPDKKDPMVRPISFAEFSASKSKIRESLRGEFDTAEPDEAKVNQILEADLAHYSRLTGGNAPGGVGYQQGSVADVASGKAPLEAGKVYTMTQGPFAGAQYRAEPDQQSGRLKLVRVK